MYKIKKKIKTKQKKQSNKQDIPRTLSSEFTFLSHLLSISSCDSIWKMRDIRAHPV